MVVRWMIILIVEYQQLRWTMVTGMWQEAAQVAVPWPLHQVLLLCKSLFICLFSFVFSRRSDSVFKEWRPKKFDINKQVAIEADVLKVWPGVSREETEIFGSFMSKLQLLHNPSEFLVDIDHHYGKSSSCWIFRTVSGHTLSCEPVNATAVIYDQF